MLLAPLFFSLSVLFGIARASASVCKVVTLNKSILQDGMVLLGYQFYRMNYVPDVLQCARYCFFRRRCLSFNYNANLTRCEFNNARLDQPNTELIKSTDFVYSDIADWGEALAFGPCSNRPCSICEACYSAENSYTCVKEELTSCRDIRICTNATADGHYYVRPVMGTSNWLKVYCHQMNTTYPKDYLTLVKENYSKYPPISSSSCSQINWGQGKPGVIYYHKIRLNVTVLHVLNKDRTFTNVSCDPSLFGISDPMSFKNSGGTCSIQYSYGTAGDCMPHGCRPRRGEFHINLEGTGLIVAPSVTWVPSGYIPTISSFYRSPTNEIITTVCGGNCGGCHPYDYLLLQPKP